MYMYLQKVIGKKAFKKISFFVGILGRSMTKIAVSGSISQRHGSADPDPDPDPPQNVMDPQHCWYLFAEAHVEDLALGGEEGAPHRVELDAGSHCLGHDAVQGLI